MILPLLFMLITMGGMFIGAGIQSMSYSVSGGIVLCIMGGLCVIPAFIELHYYVKNRGKGE
jgi:hypothetical protein